MARKKVVLVIVEGPTDEDALGISLKQYFDKFSKNVLVEVMHCDITTEWSGYPQNIREKITDVVKRNAQKNKYQKEHYSQIIHIVDTDGATETGDVTGVIDHTDLETVHLNCHLQGVIESRRSRTVNTQDRLCPTDLKTKTLFWSLYRP